MLGHAARSGVYRAALNTRHPAQPQNAPQLLAPAMQAPHDQQLLSVAPMCAQLHSLMPMMPMHLMTRTLVFWCHGWCKAPSGAPVRQAFDDNDVSAGSVATFAHCSATANNKAMCSCHIGLTLSKYASELRPLGPHVM